MAEIVSVDLLLEGITFGGGDTLTPVLANHIADHMSIISGDQVRAIVDAMFSQISANVDGDRTILNISLVTLANLTILEGNAEIFCKHTINEEGFVPRDELLMLIKAFIDHQPQQEEDGWNYTPKKGFSEDMIREDPWAYVGMILTNIVRYESGRKLLLRQSLGLVPLLAKQVQSRNPVRRRGTVGTIRTLLFDVEQHWWMLHEMKILTNILMPCVVATPFLENERAGMDAILWIAANDPNKKHEPEADILIMLMECIVLFCQKRATREDMRKWKVYPICRNLDLLQENERVSELILDVVNFIHRDEEEDPLEMEAREKAAQARWEAAQIAKIDMLFTPTDVLQFWLGKDFAAETAYTKKEQLYANMGKWFGYGAPDVMKDFEAKQKKNEALMQKAANGELDSQEVWDSPRGALAKVLLFDQFPRCIYRGTAAAFQYDTAAQRIVLDMLREDAGKGIAWINYYFRPIEKFWLSLVLQHSENMDCQRASLRFYDEGTLTEGATEEFRAAMLGTRSYPQQHFDVMNRFGRFPGRNVALGRETTAEERAWLESAECPAWAKSQLPPLPADDSVGLD